jgi:glycerophosphoryl diester phosphodiesterase
VFTYSDWTGGLAALYHRFELLGVAEDAQHERVLRDLKRMQVDAVVTDWPDRAVDAFRLVKNPS